MTEEQRRYLLDTYPLDEAQLERLVEDVERFRRDTAEEYIRRRHQELQAQGWRNESIYAQLARETVVRSFAAPPLSIRQIRRIIYG